MEEVHLNLICLLYLICLFRSYNDCRKVEGKGFCLVYGNTCEWDEHVFVKFNLTCWHDFEPGCLVDYGLCRFSLYALYAGERKTGKKAMDA